MPVLDELLGKLDLVKECSSNEKVKGREARIGLLLSCGGLNLFFSLAYFNSQFFAFVTRLVCRTTNNDIGAFCRVAVVR